MDALHHPRSLCALYPVSGLNAVKGAGQMRGIVQARLLMKGKTVVITGGTSEIGEVAAITCSGGRPYRLGRGEQVAGKSLWRGSAEAHPLSQAPVTMPLTKTCVVPPFDPSSAPAIRRSACSAAGPVAVPCRGARERIPARPGTSCLDVPPLVTQRSKSAKISPAALRACELPLSMKRQRPNTLSW
jgi:hypothetical protein